jgi:hypothetical protein
MRLYVVHSAAVALCEDCPCTGALGADCCQLVLILLLLLLLPSTLLHGVSPQRPAVLAAGALMHYT